MFFKRNGTSSIKNTKSQLWWIKLALSLIISNVFFFMLFSKNTSLPEEEVLPKNWVEMQVHAELLTPFQKGKKVILVSRSKRKKIEGILEDAPSEPEGRFTIRVHENHVQQLFQIQSWEILPFMSKLTFSQQPQGAHHEIRY